MVDEGDPANKSQEQIAKEILSYFLRNPQAADSFEGIARWRLLEDIAQRSIAATEGALAWLIHEGYLQRESIPGSRSIFLLNANRRQEAERFVSKGRDT